MENLKGKKPGEKIMRMLMMKGKKVLRGHPRTVKMLLKMVMFLEANLLMERRVLEKSMRMENMIIRLKVKVRLKEWLMRMTLKEMESHCHFLNVFF
jgi:hypothetical protein